ncbi:MAG: hypothetical protein ACRDJM_02220, partial [Actinomycetota bacterium]
MRSRLHWCTRFMVGFVPLAVVLSGCGGGRVRCRPTRVDVSQTSTLDARPDSVGDSSTLQATLLWDDGTLARTTLVFAMVVEKEVRVLGAARTDGRGTARLDLTDRFKREPRLAFAREARAAFGGGNGW